MAQVPLNEVANDSSTKNVDDNDNENESYILCSSCQVKVTNTQRTSHYRSDWHRYNVKRRCVDMPPIEKEVFEAKLAAIIARGQGTQFLSKSEQKRNFQQLNVKNELLKNAGSESQSKMEQSRPNPNEPKNLSQHLQEQRGQFGLFNGIGNKRKKLLFNFYCKLCRKSFKTQQQMESHLNTKKHSNMFIKYKEMLYIMQNEHAKDAVSNNQDFQNKNKKNKEKRKKKNKNKNNNNNNNNGNEEEYIDDIVFESDNEIMEQANKEFENELINEIAQPGANGGNNNNNNNNNINGNHLTPNGKKGKNRKSKNEENENDDEYSIFPQKYAHLQSPSELKLTENDIFSIMNAKTAMKTIKDNPFCQIQQIDLGAQKEKNEYKKKLMYEALNGVDTMESPPTKTTKSNDENGDLMEMEGIVTKKGSNNDDNNSDDSDNENEKEKILNDFAIIPVRDCLFCGNSFDCLEDCMSHMTEMHGFFIPFEKRLKSLHGLLMEAGKIVGSKHQCVWCWKVFKSLKGCQMHMRHNGHCKLQLDHGSYVPRLNSIIDEEDDSDDNIDDIDGATTTTGIENDNDEDNDNEMDSKHSDNDNDDEENDEDDNDENEENEDNDVTIDENGNMMMVAMNNEDKAGFSYIEEVVSNVYLNPKGQSPFAQYFDWNMANTSVTLQSSPGKPRDIMEYHEYNPRGVSEINTYDELIRNDGTVIGHRNHKIVYKQKIESLRKETQTVEQLISQVNNPNKKFQLEAMIRKQEIEKFENAGGNEQNKSIKKHREDNFINLNSRSHVFGVNQFKSQNRMLY